MEGIFQNIVKIIIIGCLYEIKNADCNRQFLPPPLPYYQNDNYIIPGYVPPYHEPTPLYYHPDPPLPLSYQNVNSYAPPQLFHRNENYDPTQFTSPGVRYSVPQNFPHRPQYKTNFEVKQTNSKKPMPPHPPPAEPSQKKPAYFATNIIVKEERHPSPYYHDDYSKNYHDEDYGDSYSDDSSPPPEPCIEGSPYRFFESPKPDPNSPAVGPKFTLCNPYFRPNFGSSVYTVKMPITLLPSQFPPRIEQFIERIQNYFSTYTQQQSSQPQNQNSSVPTVQPVTEASSESGIPSTAMTETLNKETTTGENFEQTNSEPPETTMEGSSAGTVNQEQVVTQKTIVVTIEVNDEETSTPAPDARPNNETQMVGESTQSLGSATDGVPVTTEEFVIDLAKYSSNEPNPLDQNLKPEVVHLEDKTVTESETVAGSNKQLNATTLGPLVDGPTGSNVTYEPSGTTTSAPELITEANSTQPTIVSSHPTRSHNNG